MMYAEAAYFNEAPVYHIAMYYERKRLQRAWNQCRAAVGRRAVHRQFSAV